MNITASNKVFYSIITALIIIAIGLGAIATNTAQSHPITEITISDNSIPLTKISIPQNSIPTTKIDWTGAILQGISVNGNIQTTGSIQATGDILSNGIKACLQNGQNCPATITKATALDWADTITQTAKFSGNVGIGTTAPAAKLDVSGGIRINSFDTAKPACNAATRGLLWISPLRDTGISFYMARIVTYQNNQNNGIYNVEYSDTGASWNIASTLGPTLSASGTTWDPVIVGVHKYWRIVLTNTPGAGGWMADLGFFTVSGRYTTTPDMLSSSGMSTFYPDKAANGVVDMAWHTDSSSPGAYIQVTIPEGNSSMTDSLEICTLAGSRYYWKTIS